MKRYYDKRNKRLIYIQKKANQEYWENHWNRENLKERIIKGKNGIYGLKKVFEYIPEKKGKILEGGCGIAQKVFCLTMYGYEIIGVDFAKQTIEKVKKIFPNLNLRVDDVRSLSFPSNFFIGYLSFGVIEHFWGGYTEIIREMRRVLIPGGYLFLSFPYMSPLRRIKAKLGFYQNWVDQEKKNFYQFALNEKVVINDLRKSNFQLLDRCPKSAIKGLMDEINLFKLILERIYYYRGKNKVIKGFRFILRRFLSKCGTGHSILLVFRKIK